MVNAQWYVSNRTIHEDLRIPFIKDVISLHATKYTSRNQNHNQLIDNLTNAHYEKKLKRQWPEDLID